VPGATHHHDPQVLRWSLLIQSRTTSLQLVFTLRGRYV
jgi:hypothetical protein